MTRPTVADIDKLGQIIFRLETNLSTLTNNTKAMQGKEQLSYDALTDLDEDLEKLKALKLELYTRLLN